MCSAVQCSVTCKQRVAPLTPRLTPCRRPPCTSQLREAFAGAKIVPKQLREKKTRAMRRALTPAQAALKTARATKKANYFPQRVFALKAAR